MQCLVHWADNETAAIEIFPTACNTRNLRGDPSMLGFNQHKTAVTICRNKEQHQVRVIAGTNMVVRSTLA